MECKDQTTLEHRTEVIRKFCVINLLRRLIFSKKMNAELLDTTFWEDSENYDFSFCLEHSKYIKLIRKMKYIKFMNTNKLNLNDITDRKKHICDFMNFSFPNKVNHLSISSFTLTKLGRSGYFNSLARLSPKILQDVTFQQCCISDGQLKRLMASFRHVQVLKLWYCKLSVPTIPDFTKALKNCQIKELDLFGSGGIEYSDWENNLEEFMNLVKGLASSKDFRLNFRILEISHCLIEEEEVEKIFHANQLGEIEIIL
ncbi:unnamed protein product [Moneuplotes crassus]|uniref:Uncharacterized protein n=1 Tax=Euplotes crassus TaxID=5936 RepID=A0AAD1UGR8_EUPCR|nr:unnamed protein product [Moneuplotes crassus]